MIGILSDTHDNLNAVGRAVRLFNDAGCSLVVHAGDFVAPFTAGALHELAAPVKAVFGNCDGERSGLARAFDGLGELQDAPHFFTHAGLRFLVCHLDGPVDRYLREHPCDVLVFGHTHKSLVEKRGTALLINPGEAGGWLSGRCTAALLDPGSLEATIIPLE